MLEEHFKNNKAFVWSFGRNEHYELGLKKDKNKSPMVSPRTSLHSKDTRPEYFPQRVIIPKNLEVKQIAIGESHSAVVTKCGKLYTCGSSFLYKLGYEAP